jgi:DNA-binding helix-hairpin-helix protein with protein kinase domain
MALEQFAYLAQIVGVVLVVVSLVYVARQLHQNTEMARIAAGSAQFQADLDLTESMIANRELAEIWVKGESQFDLLDEVNQRRLIFFERRAIVWWHHNFQLNERGLLSHSEWTAYLGIIHAVRNRQAVQASWQLFRGGFADPFRNFMDEQLKT